MKLLNFPKIKSADMPDPAALKMARDILEWCESGDVRHVAIVGVMKDGAVIDGWSSGVYRPYIMLGAITKLQMEYASKEIQTRDDR